MNPVVCPECGGDCAPECGVHPNGCVYGGSSYGYWLIADGCDLDHGESEMEYLRSQANAGHRLINGRYKIDRQMAYHGYDRLDHG